MKKIAIFASGSGSNAHRILQHFEHHPAIQVVCLLSNKPQAGALAIARQFGIPTLVFDKYSLYESRVVVEKLQLLCVDLVVLAGFLWLVPESLISAFPKQIVNIHPALLPKFGGKGMYGMHVHRAVVAAGEQQSGLTIHYANAQYDEGDIIFQAACAIAPSDTPEIVQQKVLQLEHQHYPAVIEKLLIPTQKA
ncbi:MAG TPA: phosphoribosylglycinamide formyltransferase [Microscillaceae bacterium]|jgi:phosphoribosylglycinamide formyltransferase-1|nr:phosphoribosylglycinamide formyltransferase [Microscillaceae bacterium]